MKFVRPLVLLLATTLAACAGGDSGSSPSPVPPVDTTPVPEVGLRFLVPDSTKPPLGERQVSFWAVRGKRREVRLMYQKAPGSTDSVEFARFRVDDRTLVTAADGSPLAQGDSLLITLTVVDTLKLITQFEPSGLTFNPNRPARLWLKYGESSPDLDGDGSVTAADTTLISALCIWRQEQSTDPWYKVASTLNLAEFEIEADILGFTRYAVAY